MGIDRKEYLQPGQIPQGLSGAGAARQHPLKRVHQILSYGPTGLLQGSSQIEHSGSQSEIAGQTGVGTPLTRETFHYDSAANLLGAGANQGPSAGLVHHNKVLVFEDKRYRYDAFGRLLEKRSSRMGVQRFEYDAEHRLIAVHQRPESKKLNPQQQSQAGSSTRFEYDALGRRILKTHQETSAAGHQGRPRTTRFGWDGLKLLSETREPLFEQQARHQSLYIYEDEGSYEPLARVDRTSADEKEKDKVLYFHNDLSGKPEALSSAEQGQVIWRASYKVWGNTVSEEWSGEYARVDAHTVAQNIRFQGQYLDPETGLHYNTFRFYDPDIGRFISPDPIGLEGGLRTHGYVADPLGWIDPWGLAGCSNRDVITRGPNGQILSVKGQVRPGDLGKGTGTNAASRAWAKLLGRVTDDAGHTRGSQLGGNGGKPYVFPQNPNVNRGRFQKFEGEVADYVRTTGHPVDFEQTYHYGNGGTRPTGVTYSVTDGGVPILGGPRIFPN